MVLVAVFKKKSPLLPWLALGLTVPLSKLLPGAPTGVMSPVSITLAVGQAPLLLAP
jgi:hypothetical protein